MKYNYRPDLKDGRDFEFNRRFRLSLPDAVDLRPLCSEVENQGEIGSCTAQALVANMELKEKAKKGNYTDLSRLFLYYNERAREGTLAQDNGAYIRSGIKVLQKIGICAEALHPYQEALLFVKPTLDAFKDAENRKISRYERLSGLSDIFACLADKNPVCFGISIFSGFESETVSKTGKVSMPGPDESLLGGHAILAVGYDKKEKTLICRNSWGINWGDKGYFYLPFEYVEKYGSDFWTIKEVTIMEDEKLKGISDIAKQIAEKSEKISDFIGEVVPYVVKAIESKKLELSGEEKKKIATVFLEPLLMKFVPLVLKPIILPFKGYLTGIIIDGVVSLLNEVLGHKWA